MKRLRNWWRETRRWRHCPHEHVLGIYGDMINHCGGWRNVCADCGNYLDGPVSISRGRPLDSEGGDQP